MVNIACPQQAMEKLFFYFCYEKASHEIIRRFGGLKFLAPYNGWIRSKCFYIRFIYFLIRKNKDKTLILNLF